MATTIPAIAGRIGTTDYWVTTMKAKEVCEKLVIPKDMEGWEDLSIEERYQRDININRVKKEIAPYFSNDKDRFTGSIIVAIQNDENVAFERVTEVAPKMPALYKQSATGLGLLTLSGGEVLVPLDGQHRTKAFKYAITGKDDQNRDIEDVGGDPDLAKEDIVVILVRYDPLRSRRIFNKVNRYARPTGKGQNLITDDDDVIAVIVRQAIVGNLISARLVSISKSSLNVKAPEFTTLATLYEGSLDILKAKGHPKFAQRPDAAKEKVLKAELVDTWSALLEGLDSFRLAVDDPAETGDEKRREIRRDSILGKPIGQLATVRASMELRYGTRHGLPMHGVVERLNAVPWSVAEPLWQGVLMSGAKMRSGKTAATLAADLIAYVAHADNWKDDEAEDLRERIRTNLTEDEAAKYELPPPIE